MAYRPHGKYVRVDPGSPSAVGTCDRCGMLAQLRDLVWDREWSGTAIINRRFLVHPHCFTRPNETLRTIVIPTDPDPILNARPENYGVDEAPGLRVLAGRHSLRVILQAPGVRRGARVVSGNTSLQTSF